MKMNHKQVNDALQSVENQIKVFFESLPSGLKDFKLPQGWTYRSGQIARCNTLQDMRNKIKSALNNEPVGTVIVLEKQHEVRIPAYVHSYNALHLKAKKAQRRRVKLVLHSIDESAYRYQVQATE
jgi:hypothetical protein